MVILCNINCQSTRSNNYIGNLALIKLPFLCFMRSIFPSHFLMAWWKECDMTCFKSSGVTLFHDRLHYMFYKICRICFNRSIWNVCCISCAMLHYDMWCYLSCPAQLTGYSQTKYEINIKLGRNVKLKCEMISSR